MKKLAVTATALLVLASAGGCWGPQKLTRHMDDWSNQMYVDNPWLMGNAFSSAVLRGIFAATGLIDSFINSYYFLFLDAGPVGSGAGTRFEHRPVTPSKKAS
jgi:hypothetical protein